MNELSTDDWKKLAQFISLALETRTRLLQAQAGGEECIPLNDAFLCALANFESDVSLWARYGLTIGKLMSDDMWRY